MGALTDYDNGMHFSPTLFSHWEVILTKGNPFDNLDEDSVLEVLCHMYKDTGLFPLLVHSIASMDRIKVDIPLNRGNRVAPAEFNIAVLCCHSLNHS